MKKNFTKKLALGLALVMTVGSVNMPVAAEAASNPGFKSKEVKLEVGQTKKYSMNDDVKNRWSVKKFVIGNKEVAEITAQSKAGKGKAKYVKVTGVAEGTTTLRADVKAYVSKKEKQIRIPVTVTAKEETPVVTTAELASVKQTAANAFEATFTADASKTVTAESFTTIESADGIFSAYVKSVEFSTDGKTAKVETFGNFVDGAVYNVTCAEKTASFTASVGAVATAVINTVQAQANVATDIEFTLYDANGIDVTNAIDVNTYVTLAVDGDYSDVDVDKTAKAYVTLGAAGDKVTVTLTYDPLTADGTVVTTTGTIVGVATQATVGKTTYFTMSDYAGTPKIYLNSYAEATTLYAGDAEETFYFTALDKNGDAIEYDSYEVESSNENIITVGNVAESGKYVAVDVTPEKAGTAKVIIKATKNEVVTTYSGTVVVKAERKLTSVALSTNSLTIGNNEANDNDTVTISLKDQYGNTMLASDDVSFTVDQYNDGNELTFGADAGANKVTTLISAFGGKAGSYVAEVEATDGDKTIVKKFTVKVKDASKGTENYKVELSATTMDLNPESRYNNNTAGKVTAKVAKYVGTVFHSYVNSANFTVKKGATSVDTFTATSSAAIVNVNTTGSEIKLADVTVTSGSATIFEGDIVATGTYKVEAKFKDSANKEVTKTASFTVKNTMEMPTVTVASTTGEGNTIGEVVRDCVKVDVDVLASEDASIVDVLDKNYQSVESNTEKTAVKYVVVKDTFDGQDYWYYVPVSKTFKAE